MSNLNITVRLNDPARWTKGRIAELAEKVPGAFTKAMTFSTLVLLRKVQENLSGKILNRVTGRLRSSFTTKVEGTGEGTKGIVGSNVVYAAIHEFGGVILPRRGAYLCFKIGDQWIRTRRVVMPARKYLSISVQESEDEVVQVFSDTIQDLLNKMAKP